MPHHKSAAKRLKTNERDRKRNMAVKSELRKDVKTFRAAPAEEKPGKIGEVYASLDRAARKGVIPRARANRLKSRAAKSAGRASS